MAAIKDLGLAGGVGALIGIILVWYIRPTEPGGIAFLIALPMIICAAISGIITALRGKPKTPSGNASAKKSNDPANADGSDGDGSG
jgi:hypothetical protein